MWAHHIRPSHHNNGEVLEQKESRTALEQNINIYRMYLNGKKTTAQGTREQLCIILSLFNFVFLCPRIKRRSRK